MQRQVLGQWRSSASWKCGRRIGASRRNSGTWGAERPGSCTAPLTYLFVAVPCYRLKRCWRDGTLHVIFEPLEFIGTLAALVPPPRFHEVRHYGILAPAAAWRSLVFPESEEQDLLPHAGCPAKNDAPAQTGNRKWKGRSRPRNYTRAELSKRVYLVDVLVCDRCGGRMKILCAVRRPAAIRKILTCLGLPSRPPPIAHASPAFDDPYIS